MEDKRQQCLFCLFCPKRIYWSTCFPCCHKEKDIANMLLLNEEQAILLGNHIDGAPSNDE